MNKMDRKTYGRTEIRSSRKQYNKALARFIAYTLCIAVLGCLVGYALPHHEDVIEVVNETEETKDTETLMEEINTFGSYDDRVFTSEISRDWDAAEDEGFIPLDCDMDEETQEFVWWMCKGYNIDFCLVMALIKHESNFDSQVISETNDYGYMQINQSNFSWLTETLGTTDYLNKEQNIRAGMFVLRKLFEEYSDTDMVLMSYNMGADGASKLWVKGIYTTAYTDIITQYQEEFYQQLQEKEGEEQ